MDLRRLELFLAVVDYGGFTAAANQIHVAQPSISLAMRELEREVGAQLVIRSRRGVTLTPAGEALVAPARRAVREVANASAAVAAVTGLIAGHLDVASLPTLAADPLAPMVGRFRQGYPAITVRLTAPADPRELADSVRSGHTEVGVTETGMVNDGLQEVLVSDQELVAVSPPGTAPDGRSLALRQLEAVPLVLTRRGTSMRELVETALAHAAVKPTIAVETQARDALVALVLAGAGTTFLPASVAETAAARGAVVRPTRPALRRTVVLVHRPGPLSPAATAFMHVTDTR